MILKWVGMHVVRAMSLSTTNESIKNARISHLSIISIWNAKAIKNIIWLVKNCMQFHPHSLSAQINQPCCFKVECMVREAVGGFIQDFI